MDLEDQGRIKELTEEYGKDDIVVLLGAPTTEASQVQFETVTTGDPSYAGPLAGVELGLQAYHVFEPNVKAAIDPDQYAENTSRSWRWGWMRTRSWVRWRRCGRGRRKAALARSRILPTGFFSNRNTNRA